MAVFVMAHMTGFGIGPLGKGATVSIARLRIGQLEVLAHRCYLVLSLSGPLRLNRFRFDVSSKDSHGSETTLRSLSKTPARFIERMCWVQEESWSWL